MFKSYILTKAFVIGLASLLINHTAVVVSAEEQNKTEITTKYEFKQKFSYMDYVKAVKDEHFFDDIENDDPMYLALKEKLIKLAKEYDEPEKLKFLYDYSEEYDESLHDDVKEVLDDIIEDMGCYLYWSKEEIDYTCFIEELEECQMVDGIEFEFHPLEEYIKVSENGIIRDTHGNVLIPWDQIVDNKPEEKPEEIQDDSEENPGEILDEPEEEILTLEMLKERCGDSLILIMDEDGEHILFVGGNFSDTEVTSEESALSCIRQMKELIGLEDSILLTLTRVTKGSNAKDYYHFTSEADYTLNPNAMLVLGVDSNGQVECLVAPEAGQFDEFDQMEDKCMDADDILEYFDDVFTEHGFTAATDLDIEYYAPMQQLCYVLGGYDSEGRYFKIYYSTSAYKYTDYVAIEYYESPETMESEDSYAYSYLVKDEIPTEMMEFVDYAGNIVSLPVAYEEGKGYYLLDKERKMIGTISTGKESDDFDAPEPFYFQDPSELPSYYISGFYNVSVNYDYYRELGLYEAEKVTMVHFCSELNDQQASAQYYSDSILINLYNNEVAAAFDVVGHELTHAIFHINSCDIPYENAPGAINESFADICGNLIEMIAYEDGKLGQAQVDEDHWHIGETVLDDPFRCMKYPGEHNQPSAVLGDNFVMPLYEHFKNDDEGGVHVNSGILNNIAYRMHEEAGLSYKDILKIFYNVQYLCTPSLEYKLLDSFVAYTMQKLGYSDEDIQNVKDLFETANTSLYNPSMNWHSIEVQDNLFCYIININGKELLPETVHYIGIISNGQEDIDMSRDNEGYLGIISAEELDLSDIFVNFDSTESDEVTGATIYIPEDSFLEQSEISINIHDIISAVYAESGDTVLPFSTMTEDTGEEMTKFLFLFNEGFQEDLLHVLNENNDSDDSLIAFFVSYNEECAGYDVLLRNESTYTVDIWDTMLYLQVIPTKLINERPVSEDGHVIVDLSYLDRNDYYSDDSTEDMEEADEETEEETTEETVPETEEIEKNNSETEENASDIEKVSEEANEEIEETDSEPQENDFEEAIEEEVITGNDSYAEEYTSEEVTEENDVQENYDIVIETEDIAA